jgi:multidrug efflux pump subunit AcrB
MEDIQNTPISSKNSESATLLRNIATIKPGEASGQIERYNMARVVSITANIHDSNLGTVASQIEAAIEKAGIPPAKTTVVIRGQLPPLIELLNGFRSGLIIAAVTVFLLLAANFQSFQLSTVVLSTLPAVLVGVVLMLWVTGTTINIQSSIGAIMAIGVSVANAILLVTFAENQRMKGANARDAAVLGARGRLRPVLMTSFAMMAGMLPMALGLGEAGDQIAPLGRAVIGGLAASTLATLFILPAIFCIVRGRAHRNSVSLDATDPESPLHRSLSPNSTN